MNCDELIAKYEKGLRSSSSSSSSSSPSPSKRRGAAHDWPSTRQATRGAAAKTKARRSSSPKKPLRHTERTTSRVASRSPSRSPARSPARAHPPRAASPSSPGRNGNYLEQPMGAWEDKVKKVDHVSKSEGGELMIHIQWYPRATINF